MSTNNMLAGILAMSLAFAHSIYAIAIDHQSNSLHRKRQSGAAPIAPIEDRFTPHPPPVSWYAIGDSYTASPGTGADFDHDRNCRRNNGSYAIQLENDFPFTETNTMDFLACSGYTAPQTLANTVPFIQQDNADFMVMTLGGNDVGFAGIAIDCLVRPELIFRQPCPKSLSDAERKIADPALESDIHAVYDAVFAKMRDDHHYQLYHTFYHRFFNDETDWCDRETFSTPISGPKLLKLRRQRINALVDLMNGRLEGIAESYIRKQQGKSSWSQGSRLIAINPDRLPKADGSGTYGLFDGHRFCEPGHTELEDDSVWFFGTIDHDSAPDGGNAGVKPTAIERRDEKDGRLEERQPWPEWVTQSFHPKTAGMKAIKRVVQENLQKYRAAER